MKFIVPDYILEQAADHFGVSLDHLLNCEVFRVVLKRHESFELRGDRLVHGKVSFTIDMKKMIADNTASFQPTDDPQVFELYGLLMTPREAEQVKSSCGGQTFERLPYDVLVHMIEVGQVDGMDLIRLCSSSGKLKAYCEHKDMSLFKRLLAKMNIKPGSFPEKTYAAYAKLKEIHQIDAFGLNPLALLEVIENWNPDPMLTRNPKVLYELYRKLVPKTVGWDGLQETQRQQFIKIIIDHAAQIVANFQKGYYIQDNGGEPFYVIQVGVDVKIYDSEFVEPYYSSPPNGNGEYGYFMYRIKNEDWPAEEVEIAPVLTYKSPRRVFIGKSPLNEMTEFSGGAGPEYDGNTILINDRENHYVCVTSNIFEFTSLAPIVEYVSPVGNNTVPYPYAIDEAGNYYLMAEKVVIKSTNQEFVDYMKDKMHDPYTYYYGHDKVGGRIVYEYKGGKLETEYPGERRENTKGIDVEEFYKPGKHFYIKRIPGLVEDLSTAQATHIVESFMKEKGYAKFPDYRELIERQ